MSKPVTPQQVDDLLPQTQCGLCGFGGCMPYAEALVNADAEINLCPPGGVTGLMALGNLLKKDFSVYIDEMRQKEKPQLRAVIREAECIGCTKCIQACPVDAIIGTGKLMHSVITDECTGCELCIAPCPVDCIDLVVADQNPYIPQARAQHTRQRFQAREIRLDKLKKSKQKNTLVEDKKSFLAAALLRAKLKKII